MIWILLSLMILAIINLVVIFNPFNIVADFFSVFGLGIDFILKAVIPVLNVLFIILSFVYVYFSYSAYNSLNITKLKKSNNNKSRISVSKAFRQAVEFLFEED